MRKRLWVAVSLMVIMALLVGGCAAPSAEPVPNPQPASASEVLPAEHPKGMKSLRWLTEAEKTKVIEIALNTPEAKKALEKYGTYETYLSWIALSWDDSTVTNRWGLKYEWVDEKILPPPPKNAPPDIHINLETVPETAEFYSRVTVNFAKPPEWQVTMAVNPDTGEVAFVEEYLYQATPFSQHPAELTRNLKWLTEEEKAKVIEIAMNTAEAKEAVERYGVYRTGLSWVAIKQNESGGKSIWSFDYEKVENIPEMIPEDAKFYSRVEIYFGEPEQLLMRIAVDLDTEKAVNIETHGLKILPK
ncbi:MAG: hypothetical protein ACE5LA_07145 [Dehalococcoidales bacterium]